MPGKRLDASEERSGNGILQYVCVPRQNQAQMERSRMDQLPLENVLAPPQMAAPHSARLIAMSQATLDQLASAAQ